MRNGKLAVISFAALLAVVSVAEAAAPLTFSTDFNSGVLDPNLSIATAPGYSATLSGGNVQLDKPQNIGPGFAHLNTNFTIVGDFAATVSATRTTLGNYGWSGIGFGNAHGTEEFGFCGQVGTCSGGISDSISNSFGGGQSSHNDPPSSVRFQLSRVGDTVIQQLDYGSGFFAFSPPSTAFGAGLEPVNIFLYNDNYVCCGDLANFYASPPQSVAFDNFTVIGDSFQNFKTVINNFNDLQNIQNNLSGQYIINNDISAKGLAFAPIGSASSPFTGSLEGNGHSIDGLTISLTTPQSVGAGLFSYVGSGATIDGVNLKNLTLSGESPGSGLGSLSLGGIAGVNLGTIANSSVSGTITGSGANTFVGGLVGDNSGVVVLSNTSGTILGTHSPNQPDYFASAWAGGLAGVNTGTIAQSSSAATVIANGYGGRAGGLVSNNGGAISQSYATGAVIRNGGSGLAGGLVADNSDGTIDQSYASGAVTSDDGAVGGLAGFNYRHNLGTSITHSYATGNVVGTGDFSALGGLVGEDQSGPWTIDQTFAVGTVTATNPTSFVGGLFGYGDIYPSQTGIVATNSYWDSQRSGAINGTGGGNDLGGTFDVSSATLKSGILPAGFDPSVWRATAGAYPTLQWQAAPPPPPISTPPPISPRDLSFPIVSQNPVYLNTEAGGQVYDGSIDYLHTDNNPSDPNIKGYYSLDFDTESNLKADVVAARDGIILQLINDDRRNFDPASDYNRTTVTVYHPSLSDQTKGVYIFSEYREFTLSAELRAKIDSCPTANQIVTAISTGCTFSVADDLQVKGGEAIGTLSGIANEHLHFQVKQSASLSTYGQGLSAKGSGILGTLTIAGRLIQDYQLKTTAGSLLPVGVSGTPTQILGQGDPNLPLKTKNSYQYDLIAGNLGVGVTQPVFVDPLAAIGYDFQVQSGPFFRSVLLPNVGDGIFDLYLWDLFNGDWVFETHILENAAFDFGLNGTDRFRILGIEFYAGLDPNDTSAFVTGLTFTDFGEVQFTQTPITRDIPEPPGIAIFATILTMGIYYRRYRERIRPGSRVIPAFQGWYFGQNVVGIKLIKKFLHEGLSKLCHVLKCDIVGRTLCLEYVVSPYRSIRQLCFENCGSGLELR